MEGAVVPESSGRWELLRQLPDLPLGLVLNKSSGRAHMCTNRCQIRDKKGKERGSNEEDVDWYLAGIVAGWQGARPLVLCLCNDLADGRWERNQCCGLWEEAKSRATAVIGGRRRRLHSTSVPPCLWG